VCTKEVATKGKRPANSGGGKAGRIQKDSAVSVKGTLGRAVKVNEGWGNRRGLDSFVLHGGLRALGKSRGSVCERKGKQTENASRPQVPLGGLRREEIHCGY